jgi:hypothetical protein
MPDVGGGRYPNFNRRARIFPNPYDTMNRAAARLQTSPLAPCFVFHCGKSTSDRVICDHLPFETSFGGVLTSQVRPMVVTFAMTTWYSPGRALAIRSEIESSATALPESAQHAHQHTQARLNRRYLRGQQEDDVGRARWRKLDVDKPAYFAHYPTLYACWAI